jgi:hypothetical protein
MLLGTIVETAQKKIGMRSPQKSNRARGRGNRKGGGGNNVNRVYESAGPEGKVRGTSQQIIEKYLSLARDAQTAGDRVASENFLQHAEHYQRVLALALGQSQERREQAQVDDDDQQDGEAREEQPERQDRPMRAERPRRERSAEPSVSGMQTIDSSDGEEGPDLLVTPEELGPNRPRKRRNGGGRARSEDEQDSRPAESAAD